MDEPTKAKPLEPKDEGKERTLREQQLSYERERGAREGKGMPEKPEPGRIPQQEEPRNIPKVPKEPEPMPSRTEPGKGKEEREEGEEGT